MHSKTIFITSIIIACFIVFFYWQRYAYNAPQPQYRLIKSENQIEIREYPELIVAEVTVNGERNTSIREGFRVLAAYIFGNNKRKQKIAMTAPVVQEKSDNGWVIRFIMPAEFTLSTLPDPMNDEVKFHLIKSKQYIAIRFSGSSTDENLQSHTNLLLNYIKKNNIKTTGSPIMAFYNPPWILPIFRRNEILIELQN